MGPVAPATESAARRPTKCADETLLPLMSLQSRSPSMKTVFLLCCLLAVQAFAAPNPPSKFTVTALSSSEVLLRWVDNSTNESAFTFRVATDSAMFRPTRVSGPGANTTDYVHGGRSAATTYYYQIQAKAASWWLPDSAWTPTASVTTMPDGLAAAAASPNQIDLSWTGNATNMAIKGYTIHSATNAAFDGANIHFVKRTAPMVFNSTGLSSGTTYFFKIRAEGSLGPDSTFTEAVSATTPSVAPAAPTDLTAAAASTSSIALSWDSTAGAFELQRATNSAFTRNVVRIGGLYSVTHTDINLGSFTNYWYRVRAIGTDEDSAYSSAVSARPTSSFTLLPVPRGLTANATASSRVDLSWTSGATAFELTRATDSGFTQNVVNLGGISGSTYGDTGLDPATEYHYKIRVKTATNTSASSNTASAITPAAPAIAEGEPISANFFGVNAWMPRRVGAGRLYGKLQEKWTDVQLSRVRTVRYGGTAVDQADPQWIEAGPVPPDFCPSDSSRESTMQQYLDTIDDIRAIGAEPIVQVPVLANVRNAQQAADMVRCINVTRGKGVQYWSIGNEPDKAYGWDAAGEADDIATYIKSYASAMKAVDPAIKIMAPETAWFNWDVLDLLTDGGDLDITGMDGSGRYYVDVITFHTYPFPDNTGTELWPTRADVIAAPGEFATNLQTLKVRVKTRNDARPDTDPIMTIGVTEANVGYENPTTESLDGEGTTSFLGGQFSAEMMGIAMQAGVDFYNFWSVIEGDSTLTELGYLGRDGVTVHPSYEHFKLMAEHFRGNALLSSDDQPNVKTFAARDSDQIVVMILNQDKTASFPYAIGFDPTLTTSTLNVNVPANVPAQYSSTTDLQAQSTLLLVFDSAGTLKKTIEYKRFGSSGNPSLTETP